MKKIMISIAVSVILAVPFVCGISKATENATERQYVERTESSAENAKYAKSYAESKILDMLYAENPDIEEKSMERSYPLIQIAGIKVIPEDPNTVRFTYFEFTDVSAGELLDHVDYTNYENLYQYKYREIPISKLTDNAEVAEWLRNNLDDSIVW